MSPTTLKTSKKPSTSNPATRIEKDSMGEMTVPAESLFGATTQRAVLNFPISGRPVPPEVIHAFALLKNACAQVNVDLKKLDSKLGNLIIKACDGIAAAFRDGFQSPAASEMMRHFP